MENINKRLDKIIKWPGILERKVARVQDQLTGIEERMMSKGFGDLLLKIEKYARANSREGEVSWSAKFIHEDGGYIRLTVSTESLVYPGSAIYTGDARIEPTDYGKPINTFMDTARTVAERYRKAGDEAKRINKEAAQNAKERERAIKGWFLDHFTDDCGFFGGAASAGSESP